MDEHRSSQPCWYCGRETPHTTLWTPGVTVADCDVCGAGEVTMERVSYGMDDSVGGISHNAPLARYRLPPDPDPIPQAFLDAFTAAE